jgi:ABC-type branched-subunit amino acid transport system ATPase component
MSSGTLQREPSFVRRGKAGFRTLLREASNYKELRRTPYGLKPVIIFTIFGAVASVDGRIFSTAAPEIFEDLELNPAVFFANLSLVSFALIFIVVGLSFWADRTNRVWMVGIGAIISGIFSIFTSRASNMWPLAVARVGDSLGDTARSIPVGSLFADYYPPESRGKVIALEGVIGRVIGLSAAPITFFLITATALFWRFPYLITGPLMILGGIMMIITLKNPIRGYMERRAQGASEEVARVPEEPPSFGEAWRTIWAIRTLRRLFISDIFAIPGDFIFTFFFGILLFQHYGLDLGERTLISTALAVVALPFGFLAGGMIDVLIRRRPQRVLIFSGSLSVGSSIFALVIAAAPPLWILIASFVLFGAVSTLLGPARGVLFLNILPAHVRTVGVGVRSLAAIPGTIGRIVAVNIFIQIGGEVQGPMFAAVPLLLIASIIELSSAGFYERDLRSALASQLASAEWRKAKEEGQGKLLVCRDVDVEYDGVQVLFGVDFDVEEGEIIALLGTNGAGKSTLLRAISGTQEASAGAIVCDGRDITHMPPHEIAGRGVIHMPGGRGIFPGLTVSQNLMLGNWMNEEKEGATRLEEVYRLFPILRERAGERAGLLSGGEQQMVSLAQAFLNKPKLLLIDELSLGLSPALVAELIEAVKAIHQQGTTIILVEQSVNVALTVAEKAIFMEKGEVKFVGKTRDLLSRPDILRAVYVKGTGTLTQGPVGALKSERDRRAFELEEARTILDVKDVSKSFGGIVAVSDVSFSLRDGEILGLIGPNGAGKTTLFDIITGYQSPDEGEILFEEKDITELRPDERARRRLVRRFQDARLFPSLTVYENLLVALERRLEVRSVVLNSLQLPQARRSERRIRVRADRLIETMEMGAYRDKFVKELSTGLRRITDLLCVLATEPKILLLDEPSTGIAQAEAEMLAPLLRRVRFETGCSMLIIEHDMNLISSVSDELLAMDQGKVVMRGVPEEVLNDERVIESYLGTSETTIQRSGLIA